MKKHVLKGKTQMLPITISMSWLNMSDRTKSVINKYQYITEYATQNSAQRNTDNHLK